MISKKEQAEFLVEAMPYIQKYNDKILVILQIPFDAQILSYQM